MKKMKFDFLIVITLFLVLTGFASQSNAGVRIGINISIPYTFALTPHWVVIPGTCAYV